MATATIFGSTGMVGKYILSQTLASDAFSAVHTVSRRAPAATGAGGSKLQATVEADTAQWATRLAATSPFPDVVMSAVGTTRKAAGGVANQWKIDHDLNVELAKAAKAGGARTFVFVSSAGPKAGSPMLPFLWYSRMKVGVEETVRELDFDHAIILRPGGIMDPREGSDHTGLGLFQAAIRATSYISQTWRDDLGQDAIVIGRAAVHAAELAARGKAPSKYWELDTREIIRLGRDEWEKAPGFQQAKPADAVAA